MRVLSATRQSQAAIDRAWLQRKRRKRLPVRGTKRFHSQVRCPACFLPMYSPLRREAECDKCGVTWLLEVQKDGAIVYSRARRLPRGLKLEQMAQYVTSDHGSKAKVHIDALKSLFDDD